MDDLTVDGPTTPVGRRGAVDVTNCDREPIHIPGSIQPHGVLFAFVEPALTIVSASANCEALLGVPAARLVGRTLDAVLAADDVARVCAHRAAGASVGLEALPVATSIGGVARTWTALVHRHDALALLELEPVNAPRAGQSTLLMVAAASQRLQANVDIEAACAIVAEEVRRITGFDRVKVYRFGADWSGEVLAEARDDAMPSYLGLHFPASDIPTQARALYQANPVRLIADVHYAPAPLLPDRHPQHGGPLDLRSATLRSVSPIHLQYLHNMGVGASMSASIVRNGALWGLIACHHRDALLVDFERRQACALLAQLLAARLDTHERMERARRSVRVEGLRGAMLQALADGQSVVEGIGGHGDDWMRLVASDGFAMLRTKVVAAAGRVPDAAFMAALQRWLDDEAAHDGAPVASDRLGAMLPEAAAQAQAASGVLAVPLSRADGSWLVWLRGELLQQVTWAGKPDKPPSAAGRDATLHPRQSFQAWTETVRGRSLPWTEQDVAAATQLREMVLDLTVREKDELERRNIRLALSARELETFIYVASHDIKEPLRQMEMLTSLLRSHVRPEDESDVADYFREFRTVAKRLRALTDQLAEYAKLGRAEAGFAPVALDDLMEEVLAGLRRAFDAAGATIEVGPLPVVRGQREQLHQVFVNLLANALKYRSTERPLAVVVSAVPVERHPDDDATTRAATRISVADNGIGFEPKFAEKVFDAFWRVHSRDRYEGSGIGLAICRRIVERHDGRIVATAVPDGGATFSFTLPLAEAARPDA